MPNLSIKDVSEPLAEKLRQRAERNHRSLQGELMAILERAADDDDDFLPAGSVTRGHVGVLQLMEKVAGYRVTSPSESADLVRAMRDGIKEDQS